MQSFIPPEPAQRRRRPPERLTKIGFERFVREHPRAIIDVWASWCAPCRAFAPVFEEASNAWGHRIGFGKIQAEHEPSLVARFGVRSIPTLLFFRDGRLVRTERGAISPDRLYRLLSRTFGSLP